MTNAKSIQIANDIFDSGWYQQFKESEHRKKALEEKIKTHLQQGEEKRVMFPQHNVVAKFSPQGTYSTDHTGLNNFLYELGILIPVARMSNEDDDILKLVKDFKNPKEYYTKINKSIKKVKYDLERFSLNDLVKMWSDNNVVFQRMKKEYEELREEMNNCKLLIEKQKIEFKHGTISRIAKKDTYDIRTIETEFGRDFIVNNCISSITELEKFIEKGYITKQDINEYRTLKSSTLRFIVMTLEKESDAMNFLTNRNSKGSINREQLKKAK